MSYTNYQKNKYAKTFTPRKPVRTFRDLDIYQKSMECAVIITKNMKAKLKTLRYDFLENMINCSMSVPLYIGEAHSIRFADFGIGVATFEKSWTRFNVPVSKLTERFAK